MPSWKQQSREKFSRILFNFYLKYGSGRVHPRSTLNPNFTVNMLLEHPEMILLSNPDSVKFQLHPDFVSRVSLNILDQILDKSNVFSIDQFSALENKRITPESIRLHDLDYLDPLYLAGNPHFNYHILKELFPGFSDITIIRSLSTIPAELFENGLFQKCLKLWPFGFRGKVDLDLILKHPEIYWDENFIKKVKLRFQHLIDYPFLKKLRGITIAVDWQDILQHPEYEWEYSELPKNKSIPNQDFIDVCHKYQIPPIRFIRHPNVTFKFILDQIKNFRLEHLMRGKFTLEKKIHRNKFYQEVKIKSLLLINF